MCSSFIVAFLPIWWIWFCNLDGDHLQETDSESGPLILLLDLGSVFCFSSFRMWADVGWWLDHLFTINKPFRVSLRCSHLRNQVHWGRMKPRFKLVELGQARVRTVSPWWFCGWDITGNKERCLFVRCFGVFFVFLFNFTENWLLHRRKGKNASWVK